MNITSHLFPYYPKRAINFYGLPRYMPLNAAFEGEAIQGSGCGFGMKSLRGAMGEFVERRHFFTEVPADKVGKIHEYNPEDVAEKFYTAINQIKSIDANPRDFEFQLTRVQNIFTGEEAYIPKRFVSLGKVTLEDEKFVPLMDSSGIAVHNTPDLSMRTAIHEFIERQALVGSWLSLCPVHQYDAKILADIPSLKRLASELTSQGNLYIFDIGNHMPCYTIAICYFSKSAKDKVQYVIGVATDHTLEDALESALLELWQDYIYIYCYKIYDSPQSDDDFMLYAGDTYHMSHFQDNTQDTRKVIPYFNTAKHKEMRLSEAKSFTDDELLDELKSISPYIYGYFSEDVNESFSYTRVVSPDYYLHMSIHRPLNFANSYAASLGIGEVPDNRERIPFP